MSARWDDQPPDEWETWLSTIPKSTIHRIIDWLRRP